MIVIIYYLYPPLLDYILARQLIEFPHGDGIEVILGGGRRGFLPYNKTSNSDMYGQRVDKRNLINEWESKNSADQRYKYLKTRKDLKDLEVEEVDHVLGTLCSLEFIVEYIIEHHSMVVTSSLYSDVFSPLRVE